MDYHLYDDGKLASLLREGDKTAFEEIYHRYHGLLYVFAYNRLRDREEAKDIVHELFLKLWNDRTNLVATGSLSAYLYTAVRNRIINRITRQRVADRYIDSFLSYMGQVDRQAADHLVRQHDLQAFIQAEIDKLQPRMREVFLLSRNTHLSRKEIAEQLGISEETVKSHMHQALKILKAKFGGLFFLLF